MTQLENQIYELMKQFAPIAGEILLGQRGRIQNIGKDSEHLIKDEKDPSGAYLTVLDGLIQDAFLSRLHKINPKARINAEEDTGLVALFKENLSDASTVHQDPIDGTKAYTKGLDDFSTGYAISDSNNNFTHTVVYVPIKHIMYVASPDECRVFEVSIKDTNNKKSLEDLANKIDHLQNLQMDLKNFYSRYNKGGMWRYTSEGEQELKRIESLKPYAEKLFNSERDKVVNEIASLVGRTYVTSEEITPIIKPKKVIYEKRILSNEGKKKLEDMGYEIRGMHCAHMRVIDVALGNGVAYLYGETNPHDSMIPYAFAAKSGAVLADVKGNSISGKDMGITAKDGITRFGRLPSTCYFSADAVKNGQMKEILDVLAHKENLNQEYFK